MITKDQIRNLGLERGDHVIIKLIGPDHQFAQRVMPESLGETFEVTYRLYDPGHLREGEGMIECSEFDDTGRPVIHSFDDWLVESITRVQS